MNYIIKIIILVVSLVVFLRLFLPSSEIYEYFNNNKIITRGLNNTSTMIYSKTNADEEYMKMQSGATSKQLHSELMVMNRCIELTSTSLEPLINSLRSKFFISKKLVQQYTTFSNIEESLKNNFIQLYKNSIKENKDIKFHSPIYVIVTQYPKMLTTNNTLYEHTEETSFSPIQVDTSSQNISDVDRYIEAEIYILMPSHNKTDSLDIVGKPNGKSWDDIRSSMSILLEPSLDKRVIDVNSRNSKCFTTCGSVPNNVLTVCGARNGTTSGSTVNVEETFASPSIYTSIVLNRSTNQKNGDIKVDLVNLYVVNTSVMNDIICPSPSINDTPCTQFLVHNLDIRPIGQLTIEHIPNLYARYTADSWSDIEGTTRARWNDISGNNRHCTITKGEIIVSNSTAPNGKTFKALIGNTGAGIRFPRHVLQKNYTLFHLSRYTGGVRGRIFDGINTNWLSGFHARKSGVAYYNNRWITRTNNKFGDNWVLSVSQNHSYRANGIDMTERTNTNKTIPYIALNYGRYNSNWRRRNESSDWACSEVIVYNRILSVREIQQVERFIYNKLL